MLFLGNMLYIVPNGPTCEIIISCRRDDVASSKRNISRLNGLRIDAIALLKAD